MSKQTEAKKTQNYTPKATPAYCSNCQHYKSDLVKERTSWGGEWTAEKNIRCSIGEFAIKKQGVCDLHVKAS